MMEQFMLQSQELKIVELLKGFLLKGKKFLGIYIMLEIIILGRFFFLLYFNINYEIFFL